MMSKDLTRQTLGMVLDEVSPGHARVRMRITGEMVNLHGTVHGGYLFLLADTAFAYASNTFGPMAVAQSAQITFLRPAEVNDVLQAEAVQRTRSGRTSVYDVAITEPGGAVIAEFRGQSMFVGGLNA
jgi:acyl-CoA thioesterase